MRTYFIGGRLDCLGIEGACADKKGEYDLAFRNAYCAIFTYKEVFYPLNAIFLNLFRAHEYLSVDIFESAKKDKPLLEFDSVIWAGFCERFYVPSSYLPLGAFDLKEIINEKEEFSRYIDVFASAPTIKAMAKARSYGNGLGHKDYGHLGLTPAVLTDSNVLTDTSSPRFDKDLSQSNKKESCQVKNTFDISGTFTAQEDFIIDAYGRKRNPKTLQLIDSEDSNVTFSSIKNTIRDLD